MLARFEMIGIIGKITIPDKMKDKECVFISMVTSNSFKGKYYTQWINQIAVWGSASRHIRENMLPGQLWWVAGDFKSVKRGKKEEIMFNVQLFRKLRDNKDETIENLKEREMEKFLAAAAYDEYEEEYDDRAYEKHHKKVMENSKKKK